MEFTWDRLRQLFKWAAQQDQYDSPYVDDGEDNILIDGSLRRVDFETWRAAHGITWTTEKPTRPGWYWVKEMRWIASGDKFAVPEIVCIVLSADRLGFYVDVADERAWIGLHEVSGEWAGPLEVPVTNREVAG